MKRAVFTALRPIRPLYRATRPLSDRIRWAASGRSLVPPPPTIKRDTILEYARRYGLRTLVETGTFTGDTVARLERSFDRLYSIELSDFFHERAKRRFARSSKVSLLKGNSGDVLGSLVPTLDRPALFWLDAHYSGGDTAHGPTDCPAREELRAIFASSLPHVVLIDDAREFVGGVYPTIDEIRALSAPRSVDVKNDIIRIA